MHVRIKICGITRYDDARIAANLGVDALGFIFHPKSPRYIEPFAAREIIRQLPPFVSRVGVFVNTPEATIIEIAHEAGLDTIQLHGDEPPEVADRLPFPAVKAFSIRPDSDLSILDEYRVAGYLLDTWDESVRGGSGRTFDWRVAERAARLHPIILAGGLGPTNIREALDFVNPYGVDVNSGVEISPGIKNPAKMKDVITLVKGWKATIRPL